MGNKLLAEWFWTDRWFGSSGFLLPLEARGLYREMLTAAWRREARLPNDHAAIRRAVGVTDEEWARAWPQVKRFWAEEDGWLVNRTQQEVYADSLALHEGHVAGGKARANSADRDSSGQFKPRSRRLASKLPASSPASCPAIVQPLSPISVSVSISDSSHTQSPTAPGKGPTLVGEMIGFWQEQERLGGVQPHGDYGRHGKTFKTLLAACGASVDAAKGAIAAYFADRSAFVVQQGHSIGEFTRTLEKWVRLATGAAPAVESATASQFARVKALVGKLKERKEANGHVAIDDAPF